MQAVEQMNKLKAENVSLRQSIDDLKRELEAVVLDAECLKDEREEIEKLLQVDSKEDLSHTGSLTRIFLGMDFFIRAFFE